MIKRLLTQCFLWIIVTPLLTIAFFRGNVLAKDLESIVEDIQKRYESIETLQFEFSQELSLRGAEDFLEARGTALFKKPGMMKWEYLSPNEQQIVSDGETIWIFQIPFNQVIVSSFPKERNVARDFLSGMGRLGEDFFIEPLTGSDDSYLLKLTPRESQSNTTGLIIKVDKSTSMVQEFTNFDLLGNATKITISKVEINPGLSSDLFTFKIPEGAKVVREGEGQEFMEDEIQFMEE
jgi:outer membrane lipoprotein carrier protein